MGARHFGFKEEGTYGTAVTPDVFVEVLDMNINEEPNFEQIKSIRSFSVRQMIELNSLVTGDCTVQGDYQTIADILYHFYGVAPTTTGAGPYTHTLPPTAGLAATGRVGVSATLEERRDGTLVWQHAGCKLTGFGASFGVDQSARLALSWVGQATDNTPSPATASYRDFDVIKPSDCTVNIDGNAQDAMSFSINAGFDVDRPFVLGSTTFGQEPVENDSLSVAGSIEVLFADMTEYDLFKTRADVDVQLSATDGTHSATFNMNKARLTKFGIPVQGKERLKATIEYESFFDAVATENMQAVIVNDVATIP